MKPNDKPLDKHKQTGKVTCPLLRVVQVIKFTY